MVINGDPDAVPPFLSLVLVYLTPPAFLFGCSNLAVRTKYKELTRAKLPIIMAALKFLANPVINIGTGCLIYSKCRIQCDIFAYL
jgi:hypothetical protein